MGSSKMTSELNWKFNILQLLLCLNGIWANPKPEAEDTYYTPYVPPNYVPDQPYPVTPSSYAPPASIPPSATILPRHPSTSPNTHPTPFEPCARTIPTKPFEPCTGTSLPTQSIRTTRLRGQSQTQTKLLS